MLIDVRHQFNNYLIINGGQYCIAQCEPNLELIYFIYAQETQENWGKKGMWGMVEI